MKVNENYLQRLFQRVDCWNQGIDYLGISIHGELEFGEHFIRLDNDNSNIALTNGEYFTYTLCKNAMNKHKSLWILVSIDQIAYPIIKLTSFNSNHGGGFIGCDYGLYFLGTFYRLVEQGIFPDINTILRDIFSKKDMIVIENSHINRLDYKIDMMTNSKRRIPSINKILHKRSDTDYNEWKQTQNTHNEYQDAKNVVRILDKIKKGEKFNFETISEQNQGEYITGWSIGKKDTKTVRVRCYDKLLDSLAKSKYHLYDDYFQYESVYRLESEFRTRFCRDHFGKHILYRNINELITKAKSYMGLGPKRESGYCYKPNYDISQVRIPYLKKYQNAGYKIYKNKISGSQLYWDKLLEEGHGHSEILYLLTKDKEYIQKLFHDYMEE